MESDQVVITLSEGTFTQEQVEDFAAISDATIYLTIAVSILIIYEYFITLDLEVAYIWATSPRFTFTKFIFFINRYYPIARVIIHLATLLPGTHSYGVCTDLTDFHSFSTLFNVATVEILMLLRAWAVWNRSAIVGTTLILCFTLSLAGCMVINIVEVYPDIPGVVKLPPEEIWLCERAPPSKFVSQYSIGVVLELISFAFLFCRILWMSKSSEKQEVPILKALRIQGTWYFATVITSMVITIIAGFQKHLALPVMYSGAAATISSITCTRIILALRGMYMDPDATTESSNGEPYPDYWDPPELTASLQGLYPGTASTQRSKLHHTQDTGQRSVYLDFVLPKLDSFHSQDSLEEMYSFEEKSGSRTTSFYYDVERGASIISFTSDYVTAESKIIPTPPTRGSTPGGDLSQRSGSVTRHLAVPTFARRFTDIETGIAR